MASRFPPNFTPDARLRDLPLREFHPRPALRRPEHLVARAPVPAIDAHNHLGRWLTSGGWAAERIQDTFAAMEQANVTAVVNLDGRWGDELEHNLDRYDRAYPDRFATFCHLDWTEAAVGPGFGDRLAASLERSASAGARGVKVWKDLGLHVRDHRGELLMPDDPRLAAVWEAAADLDLPILIHTADPIAFFDPVDETNERLEELIGNPDWWFGDRERFPSFDELMGSLAGLVGAHPEASFIGAHAGCCAEDLGWLGQMLDTYPNFSVDIAARIAELGRQPRLARALIVRHPDRFLFGTDAFPPDASIYATHFRFLETADEHFPSEPDGSTGQGRWAIDGLHLPRDVLRAVYRDNALRLIPGLRS